MRFSVHLVSDYKLVEILTSKRVQRYFAKGNGKETRITFRALNIVDEKYFVICHDNSSVSK